MFSRGNLQEIHKLLFILVVVVTFSGCLCLFPDDDVDVRLSLASSFSQNDTDSSADVFQGSPKASSSNEIYNGESERQPTPHLSTPPPPSTTASTVAEMSTVTITPSTVAMPSMIITATKVTLDHRMGSSTESTDDGSTEEPNVASADDASSTDSPISSNFSPEKLSSSEKSSEAAKSSIIGHSYRKARYHRLRDDLAQNIDVDESVTEPTVSSSTGTDFHDGSVEIKENEEDGGASYGDFQEENEIPEQLPTPLALINPNGEGNNPPLEDDFAEAFKKANANGKRRRFRGGRRGRMKMKKHLNGTKVHSNTDSTPTVDSSTAASAQQEYRQQVHDQQNESDDYSFPSTPKYKRLRSTTSSPPLVRSTGTPSTSTTTTTTTTTTTEAPPLEGSPVVRSGPKPMIMKHVQPLDSNSVTPSPQLEKPSGHTEKISTYFFSTPSPSARLRLRQKIRESYPSSTTTSTSTTTQAPLNDQSNSYPSGDGHEVWKNDFPDFQRNSYFAGPSTNNFKIPAFVPLNLGLEQDQQEPVENSIARPESNSALENKVYSFKSHSSDSVMTYTSPPSISANRGTYDFYSSSSTTPRPRTRHHSFIRNRDRDYESHTPATPTSESDKSSGGEYYAQGSNTESSTTHSSQRTTPGSHYDRTKDRVIFYNDSPYSAQHSPAPPSSMEPPTEPSSGSSSQTLSGSYQVSESTSIYDSPQSDSSHAGFTRGKVYPADDSPSHHEIRFKNGPPDSSHIDSPNILEHQTSSSPEQDSGSHHYRHSHDSYPEPPIAQTPPGPPLGGGYSHAHIETSHSPMSRPGDSSVYGTVEEVPAHGSGSYEHTQSHHHHSPYPHHHHRNHHHHLHHHGIHSSGPFPYPFGSPSHYAPSMSPYPPPPAPPPPPSLMSPPDNFIPPMPSPPPPQSYYPHEFAPSFHMPPSGSSNDNQPDSHFPMSPSHLAGSPSEIVHGSVSPINSPPESESPSQSVGPIPSDSESTHPVSPDPYSSVNDDSPPTADPQQVYNQPQMPDHNFPAHSHTMSTHADYEPANPPLPHDHPFHKSFIPFPTQDLHGAISLATLEQDHPSQDINSIGSGPYHPGTVENVPTGRPPFQPSPLIPSKQQQPFEFVPIPDDVKENDIFSSYPTKPYDGPPPGSHHETPDHHSHGSPPTEVVDHHHHLPTLVHQDGQPNPYLGSGGESHSPYPVPPGPPNGDHGKDPGYAGPVTEIHSGIYRPPPNSEHGHESVNKPPPYPGDHPRDSFSQVDLSGPGGPLVPEKDLNDEHPVNHGPPGLHDPSELNGGLHGHGPSGPHDLKNGPHGRPGGKEGGKKGSGKLKGSFSNTPYVLMFPQLIPEEKMRPSPPTVLQKEIPVIQASSMSDFTSGMSGEKPPLAPGFQAVPVHPRHQMYQVLAKTHYDKMMEKYRESKRKPPSAIYTPYGILVPVGTSVDAASSIQHSVFAKPRLPPKFRGEKSLLSTLLGSPSTTSNRFFPPGPGGVNNKLSKLLEFEPAIDLLAEKLAMKIVTAQHALNGDKKSGNEKDGMKGSGSRYKDLEDHMTMESKTYSTQQLNPEMADYIKGVLKGQITEMVETTVSDEDRRPSSISSKFLNSLFRKGRINIPGPMPPKPLMSMASPSMPLQNKVPPPQGPGPMQGMQAMQSMQGGNGGPPPPMHTGMGPPFAPPQLSMPQGPPGGLLGTIRRLFSFGPPERHDVGLGPNFAGRTLYTGNNNGTGPNYVDGPSPRSSHFPSQSIHQYPMMQQMHHSKMKSISPSQPFNISVVQKNFNSSNKQMVLPTSKPSKKKKKSSSSSSSDSNSKKPSEGNRLTPSSSFFNKSASSTFNSSTTPKPTLLVNKSVNSFFSLNKSSNNSSASSSSDSSSTLTKKTASKPNNLLNSPFLVDTPYAGILSSLRGDQVQVPPDNSKNTEESYIKNESPLPTIKPLDLFQTLLGSTRSVLNFFKSEARKSSGPTVLIPRSASFRKRRSLIGL